VPALASRTCYLDVDVAASGAPRSRRHHRRLFVYQPCHPHPTVPVPGAATGRPGPPALQTLVEVHGSNGVADQILVAAMLHYFTVVEDVDVVHVAEGPGAVGSDDSDPAGLVAL
jgi:hypothetical protein